VPYANVGPDGQISGPPSGPAAAAAPPPPKKPPADLNGLY
jgi:hypothetical protein